MWRISKQLRGSAVLSVPYSLLPRRGREQQDTPEELRASGSACWPALAAREAR